MSDDEEERPPPEPDLDENREIPRFGGALRKLLEQQELEEKLNPKKNKQSEDVGLPERPNKRIKEKFRRDRENIEKALNARGDSLYKSKRDEMMMQNSWGGGSNMGWGEGEQSPWAGWPGKQQSSTSFGGWGGNSTTSDQESPFGRSKRVVEDGDENQEEYDEEQSSGKKNYDFETEDAYNSDVEARGEEGGDFDEDEVEQTEKAFAKAELDESLDAEEDGNDEENYQEDDDSFRNEGESEEYEENMPAMQGDEGTQEGTALQEQDLDPYGRPKKKLKEKFMRDRENLENMLNAKGESMYRRPGDPPPGALAPTDDGSDPAPPAYPDRGRVMMPDEVRAHMALQKIARAALMASKKRGRKGKASIVFI